MKTCIYMLIICLMTACTKTNDQKAEKLILDHLSKSMNDFKSYESVEFGVLDSTFTEFDEYDYLSSDTLIFENEIDKANYISQKRLDFKKQFIGYKKQHTFRGKNSFGANVISDYLFYFDKDLTKVTKALDRVEATKKAQDELEKIKTANEEAARMLYQ